MRRLRKQTSQGPKAKADWKISAAASNYKRATENFITCFQERFFFLLLLLKNVRNHVVVLAVTSEPRNPSLPSFKFNRLEKKSAQSFKEMPASPGHRPVAHTEVFESGISRQDVQSPASYTWHIPLQILPQH